MTVTIIPLTSSAPPPAVHYVRRHRNRSLRGRRVPDARDAGAVVVQVEVGARPTLESQLATLMAKAQDGLEEQLDELLSKLAA